MYKPFDKRELRTIGQYPVVESDTFTFPGVFTDKLDTPITPRENFDLFFDRKGPLWVPDVTTDLNFQYPAVIPDSIACGWSGGLDAFGCKWVPDISAPDLPSFPEPGNIMLKDIADWRELKWPDPDEWDWEKAEEEHKVLDPDRPIAVFLWSSLFERMITLMGFENAAMSFIEDPDSTHDFIRRLQDYNIDLIEHVKKYLHADIIVMSDDWSSQKAPFFSTGIAEEFLAPHVQALAQRTHELGMHFMHHCCGNSSAFVPIMIDEGVDWWQYNYEAVKDNIRETIEKYGDRILFDGYPGYVKPLPDDDEEFKEESRRLYHELAHTMHSSFTITNLKENRGFDVRKFTYQLAREEACEANRPK